MTSLSKQIGCIFLIIGTSLGGGILAIPMLLSYFGAIPGTIIMFVIWLLMTYSTLAVAEACQHYDIGISYIGLSHKLFGKVGQLTVYICAFGILYGMLTAYISAMGSTFNEYFGVDPKIVELIFVIIFAFFILKGTSSAEILNRVFLTLKLIIIISVIVGLILHMNPILLLKTANPNMEQMAMVMPVLATTFSAHIVIPTVRNYIGNKSDDIRRVIMIASFIILAIYVLWIIAIFGCIPIHGTNTSFAHFTSHDASLSVEEFLKIISVNIDDKIVTNALFTFIALSVTTAFIALSLSLRDLYLDRFEKLRNVSIVPKTVILTILLFCIPLLINFTFANIFLKMLSIVGLFALVMLVSCPLNMVRLLRNKGNKLIYPSMSVKFLNRLALTVSGLIIALQLIDYFL